MLLCGFMRASALNSNSSMAVCTQNAKPWRPPLFAPPAPVASPIPIDLSSVFESATSNMIKLEKQIFIFTAALTLAAVNLYRLFSDAAIRAAFIFSLPFRIVLAPFFRNFNSAFSGSRVFSLFGIIFSLAGKIFFITHRIVSDSFSIGAPSFLFAPVGVDGGESFRVGGKFCPPAYFCSPQTFSSRIVHHDDGHSIYSLKGEVKCQRPCM